MTLGTNGPGDPRWEGRRQSEAQGEEHGIVPGQVWVTGNPSTANVLFRVVKIVRLTRPRSRGGQLVAVCLEGSSLIGARAFRTVRVDRFHERHRFTLFAPSLREAFLKLRHRASAAPD